MLWKSCGLLSITLNFAGSGWFQWRAARCLCAVMNFCAVMHLSWCITAQKHCAHLHWHTTTTTVYGPLSWTTRVSRYQKKHSPTHHPYHHPIFISFFHLPRSIASYIASSVFKLRAWQSFCTTSLHVIFGLPPGLEPSTSYSIHFFTQSVSSFRSTCPLVSTEGV